MYICGCVYINCKTIRALLSGSYISPSLGTGEEGNRDAFLRAAEGVVVPLALPRVSHELCVYLAQWDASHLAVGDSCMQPWE